MANCPLHEVQPQRLPRIIHQGSPSGFRPGRHLTALLARCPRVCIRLNPTNPLLGTLPATHAPVTATGVEIPPDGAELVV
ncbi:hypothetical protein [Streptomyces bungoensis]|uniref:hypothetical protein n=1 Tax=Streptomyces bungoensis TaxID=285568 RepID=UPI003447CF34